MIVGESLAPSVYLVIALQQDRVVCLTRANRVRIPAERLSSTALARRYTCVCFMWIRGLIVAGECMRPLVAYIGEGYRDRAVQLPLDSQIPGVDSWKPIRIVTDI